MITFLIILILGIVFGLIFKLIGKSMKFIFKLLINSLIGAAALVLINMVGVYFGITITVNLITGLVVGILGIPGVIILLILQLLGMI